MGDLVGRSHSSAWFGRLLGALVGLALGTAALAQSGGGPLIWGRQHLRPARGRADRPVDDPGPRLGSGFSSVSGGYLLVVAVKNDGTVWTCG